MRRPNHRRDDAIAIGIGVGLFAPTEVGPGVQPEYLGWCRSADLAFLGDGCSAVPCGTVDAAILGFDGLERQRI